MYKKKKITYPPCISEDSISSCEYNPFVDKVVVAHPMSYYLNGGVDLDGISTRKPLPGAFDDATLSGFKSDKMTFITQSLLHPVMSMYLPILQLVDLI